MANDVHFGVELLNMNEIYAMVADLENIDKNKAIKYGLRRAGNDMIAGGKMRLQARMRNANGITGDTLSSFRLRVKRRKLGALAGFDWGLVAYKKANGRMGTMSALLDRGTRAERFHKNGKSTGWMPSAKGSSYKTSFWEDTRDLDGYEAIKQLKIGIENAVAKIQSRRK